MLPFEMVFPALLATLGVALAMRVTIALYYNDGERILVMLKLRPGQKNISYYKRFDLLLAPFPFLYCWAEIFAALLFFRWSGFNPLAGVLLVIVSAGRMRALQEVGHNALHAALCPSKKFQWLLSNVLFQFPIFKRDMDSRFIAHVKQHHPNADIPGKDPNHTRIVAGGMVPGISTLGFIRALLYPLLPHGLMNSMMTMARAALFQNSNAWIFLLRLGTVAVVATLFVWLGGWQGLVFGYIIPMVAFYPLFSWLSLLSKHRWHTPYVEGMDKRSHDYEHGRATDFSGLFGPILRYLIYPMSDAYHLAHHIYPFVRTEYMPALDRELKISEPRYTQYISDGFLFGRNGQPAALSELYDRLVRAPVAHAGAELGPAE